MKNYIYKNKPFNSIAIICSVYLKKLKFLKLCNVALLSSVLLLTACSTNEFKDFKDTVTGFIDSVISYIFGSDPEDTATWSNWSKWSPAIANSNTKQIKQTRTRTCKVTVNGKTDEVAPTCSGDTKVNRTIANPAYIPRVPDLIISSFTVSNKAVITNQSISLYATVRNSGRSVSGLTTLRYYRSSKATITNDDTRATQVATGTVSGLSIGSTSDKTASVAVPTKAGTYYYGVCVNSVVSELNTNNNCSSSVAVKVSGRPDLTISSFTASNKTPTLGQRISFSAVVRNSEDSASAPTTLRYYRSSNATITNDDTQIASGTVSGLLKGSTGDKTASITAPKTAGTYYYGACVDTVKDELNKNNNCSSGVAITVSGLTDLAISSFIVSNKTPTIGQSIYLYTTVSNSKSAASGATTLRYYLSSNSTITNDDIEVATDTISSLAAGDTTGNKTASVAVPTTAGTYYYGVCVDTVEGESITDNNCSSGVAVTVPLNPDLAISSFIVDNKTPTTGQSINLYATVRNSENADSGATILRYYRSSNDTITNNDAEVAADNISNLVAGGTVNETVSVAVPNNAGKYYYGACIDSVAGESITDNNCSSGFAVTVSSSSGFVDKTYGSIAAVSLSQRIAFNWNAHPRATSYRVYGSDSDIINFDFIDNSYTLLETLSGISTTTYTHILGKNYTFYGVFACTQKNSCTISQLQKVNDNRALRFLVSWSGVSNAAKYIVRKSIHSSCSFNTSNGELVGACANAEKVGETTELSLLDTEINASSNYYVLILYDK